MIRKSLRHLLANKKPVYLVMLVIAISLLASSFKKVTTPIVNCSYASGGDSILSVQAFMEVYKVLMSPRCMNCHPSGDIPLVGEDSHLHADGVKRGKDGKGMYSNKCVNCHLDENQPGANKPPGNPNWHLPPTNMKMVFQGKSARALAAQLLDTASNGNKTKEDLIKHITNDGLVLAGWNPGEGRKQPPLSHEEFAKQFKNWIDYGAYLPEK